MTDDTPLKNVLAAKLNKHHDSQLSRRRSTETAEIEQAIYDNVLYMIGQIPALADQKDYYHGLAYAVRDRLQQHWMYTINAYIANDVKAISYLSAEFLLGPHLGNNLLNLGIEDAAHKAVQEIGYQLDEILALEEEPGLGNGGLGRLAACYMDSLATLEKPAIGYGIRYEFGIFTQEIRDGWQKEITDKWLHDGNPWEIAKPDLAYYVSMGGHTETYQDELGVTRVRWIPERVVKGMAYDTPILGYRVNTCNTLRLWSAEACESFDFAAFNTGDYYSAVNDKVFSETFTKVLYPNDEPIIGKKLRLMQQYFFVSCSLQDMLHILDILKLAPQKFAEKFAVQLNDTHPSIGVAELMRLLVDIRHLDWDEAWDITVATFGYTNHTLLPEALETWPLPMFAELLPRHLEIIYEINARFLNQVRQKFPDDEDMVRRVSIIDETGEKHVRMAYLACIGSHAINGVAALHSELLKNHLLRDFYAIWPERFHNITNGVTPRRFMALANPKLAELLTSKVGADWLTHMQELKTIERFADDNAFREHWREIKHDNKTRLAGYIKENTGVELDPAWLFDIQVKRIHEYKRQHLNVLSIITFYQRLKANPGLSIAPRAYIFGGKAAPGYYMAKCIIKLINAVAEVVNNDPEVNQIMKVVFIPNFSVKNAQIIYPAADLSEQVSMAGKEASGTGNMKFTLNGALTIGTLDGANIEIRDAVGADNFFLFGLTAEEASQLQQSGYQPGDYLRDNPELNSAIQLIASGHFSNGDTEVFRPLVENLCTNDPFLVFADYAAYVKCQEKVSEVWQDKDKWTKMSILNTARAGKFSSDRAINEYCDELWSVKSVPVTIDHT